MSIRDEVVKRHLAGKSYSQIANALGVSRGTVGGHLARWRETGGGDEPRENGKPWTAQDIKTLSQKYMAGAALGQIAVSLGRSVRAIEIRLSAMRLEGDIGCRREITPDYLEAHLRAKQKRDDDRFFHALCLAFQRGDHLPAMKAAA